MKQKVAICLGFLHDPRAVILDEPLTGLDPLGIRSMKDAILDRAKNQGAAVVVSSHQLELMEEICDEIVLLDKGRCVASGTRDELQARLNASVSGLSLEEIFLRLVEEERARDCPMISACPVLPGHDRKEPVAPGAPRPQVASKHLAIAVAVLFFAFIWFMVSRAQAQANVHDRAEPPCAGT